MQKTMWTPIPSTPESKVPSARSKHASVLYGQYLYLLGGRNGNVPLKDFWRYNIAENLWQELKADGDLPGCLQEHTIVGYKGVLYVFGGEVGFSNGTETPLWMYNIKDNKWKKFNPPKGVHTPKGRRSHSATVFQDSMYIYGGYQDLKGSSSELWAFHFESETWHLVSQGGFVDGPSPRHRHSAVLHDSAMWVFGGMTDLQERSDFWRFDFISRRWRPVKSKPGPGLLHSHTAVKFLSVMMIFGGEKDGQTTNDIWRFHFATEFWEKLTFVFSQPMPRAQSTAFIFSQFTSRGTVHYMGLPEQDYLGSQPEPTYQQKVPTSVPGTQLLQQIQNNVMSEGKKYTFSAADSCIDEVEQLSQEIMRGLKRPNHFQRLDIQEGRSTQAKPQILKDIAKISQFNLARLSQYCSYSIFSNESTESLNTASSAASPCSIRLAKSHSSHSNLGRLNFETDSSATPSSNFSPNKMSKDLISVPNFATLKKSDSIEDSNYQNQPDLLHKVSSMLEKSATKSSPTSSSDSSSSPMQMRSSDSAFTFQSYDCSSRSSTVSSSSNMIPKSSSINRGFTLGEVQLVDLEEEEKAAKFYANQEFRSPMSGYESGCYEEETAEESKLSFSNPNYLSPEIQSEMERRKENRGNVLLRDESHQSFANALNSPADSLFSDFQDFHCRLQQDMELTSVKSSGKRRPLSTFVEENVKKTTMDSNGKRNPRPLSAEIMRENKVAPYNDRDKDLVLNMYIVGGREVGQVTVFRRPISIWKLDLTKTF